MNIIEEIELDINSRLSELTTIKTIPIHYGFTKEHREIYFSHSVSAIYAIWEGYVRETFFKYVKYINSLELSYEDIKSNLLTHAIDEQLTLSNTRESWESKVRLALDFKEIINKNVKLKLKIPTKANVQYDVLTEIFSKYCIEHMLDQKYKEKLNKLLNIRNKCAHGEGSVKVKIEDIEDFIKTIQNLMYDTLLFIETSVKNESFKKAIS